MNEIDSSNVIAFRARKNPPKPAERHERDHVYLTMLYALTEYVASKLQIGSETVQAMVVTAFGIRSFDQLKISDFENASKYIIDLLDDHAVIH